MQPQNFLSADLRCGMRQNAAAEVIFRVRAELNRTRRELRLYGLCRSGSGAWLVSIAPFEELFFDEGLVCGVSVREALQRLERRYAHCRRLVTLAG